MNEKFRRKESLLKIKYWLETGFDRSFWLILEVFEKEKLHIWFQIFFHLKIQAKYFRHQKLPVVAVIFKRGIVA